VREPLVPKYNCSPSVNALVLILDTKPFVIICMIWLLVLVSLAIARTSDFVKLVLSARETCGKPPVAPEM
jgi:hypothetical protein